MTATIAPRTIKTRRMEFRHDPSMPHHFAGGDPAMSHIVSTLSALFPEGEDFFVQAVRNYRDRITDPELKKQVGGFIGQEAIHGREHRAFNEQLAAMGYPTQLLDRLTKYGFAVGAKVLPKSHQLAITAALEHYTATLAEVLLGEPEAMGRFNDDEVRNLFMWHAVEEAEHKSVAFDVYQHVSGNQVRRRVVMNITTVGFLAAAVSGSLLSMALDGSTWRNPGRTWASLRKLPGSPWLTKAVRRRIRDYNRDDFHPDDHDATALLEEWRERFFGADGSLNDRMKSGAAPVQVA
ncbi:MAG: metal-dependent hydrolase [Actinomycetota bacterium]|nr:metal-dependent hydrolase [Actinomycetota bacterium]